MQVKLENVRIAYAQGLFEPRVPREGQGKAKYNCAFLFPKDHPAVKALTDACVAVAKAKWGPKADANLAAIKAGDKLPVHNGDAKPESAGYAGNLYMNASNEIRPTVVDGNRAPLTAADGKPYSGCYVNAIVDVWAQDNKFGKRINASLMGVQFYADGEKLAGGSVAAADDFEAIPAAKVEEAAEGGGAASLF